jgi:hypothetical protein
MCGFGEVGPTVAVQPRTTSEASPTRSNLIEPLGLGPLHEGLLTDCKERGAVALALGRHDRHPKHHVRTGIRVASGLDVKASGGYVVVPPSVGPNDEPYEWIVSPGEAGLADPPEWLIERQRTLRSRWRNSRTSWRKNCGRGKRTLRRARRELQKLTF